MRYFGGGGGGDFRVSRLRGQQQARNSWQRGRARSERAGAYFTCDHAPIRYVKQRAATWRTYFCSYTCRDPRTYKQDHSVLFSRTRSGWIPSRRRDKTRHRWLYVRDKFVFPNCPPFCPLARPLRYAYTQHVPPMYAFFNFVEQTRVLTKTVRSEEPRVLEKIVV